MLAMVGTHLEELVLRPAGTGGWIGYWAPGIGDPSVVGWVTVALYFLDAWLVWVVLQRRRAGMWRGELRLWQVLFVLLIGLGFNKQLDLQSALTELGRLMAYDEGWYDYRHRVQRIFILGVGLTSIACGVVMLAIMRRSPPATRVTALGACALLAFILIRASSFHHVDYFIRSSIWGIRWNWVIEVGGLIVIALGTFARAARRRRPAPAPAPPKIKIRLVR